MFKISQRADYGLILLSNLAKAKGRVSVSKVAQKHLISTKYLSQIAQELKKAGLISAKEGANGGYILAKKPKDIKLLDALQVIDGDFFKGECFQDDHNCVCGAGEMWEDMRERINSTLGTKTVADLKMT